jgi:hypothetical protein
MACAWCEAERARARGRFFVSPFPPWARAAAEQWGHTASGRALDEDDEATIDAVLDRLSEDGHDYPPSVREALLDSLGLNRQAVAQLSSLRGRINELLPQASRDGDDWFSYADVSRSRGESFLERFLREHQLGLRF